MLGVTFGRALDKCYPAAMRRVTDSRAVLAGIGAEVRRRREQLDLTEVQLAKKARVHPNVDGRLERGICNPSVVVLCALAEALRAPATDLIKTK